jgi:hypothetical protein
MIQLDAHAAKQAGIAGKEPMVVRHDIHTRELFTNTGLMALFDSVADKSIKAKTACQNRSEEFNIHLIPHAPN